MTTKHTAMEIFVLWLWYWHTQQKQPSTNGKLVNSASILLNTDLTGETEVCWEYSSCVLLGHGNVIGNAGQWGGVFSATKGRLVGKYYKGIQYWSLKFLGDLFLVDKAGNISFSYPNEPEFAKDRPRAEEFLYWLETYPLEATSILSSLKAGSTPVVEVIGLEI